MKYDHTLGAPIANVSRRTFLSGIAAGSLILSVGLSARADDPPKYAGDGMPNGLREEPKIFIAIGEDGTIYVTTGASIPNAGSVVSWKP